MLSRPFESASRPLNGGGCHRLWLRDLDHLPEELPHMGNAFAAPGLCAEGPVNGRHGAVLVRGMGAKLAIGDGVAEANVHSALSRTLTMCI